MRGCDLCQEIAGGRSVDVIEIDAASNTKVEETKSILEGVRYLPARARRKVYIIDEVHMLSAHSFNALLKTLEEPPPHVVFVFATTEVHKIPVTILSRCQRFDFKLIPTVRLAEHLDGILRAEKIKAAPDAVRLIARQAAGSVRDALSLLDQAIAYVAPEPLTAEVTADVLGVADRRLLVELAGAALDRDAGTALRLVARAADRGVDFGELGRSFLGFLRDLEVIARVSGSGKVDVADLVDATPEEIEEARALAAARGAGAVSGAVRSLGACGRRGVAPADAASVLRDGGARYLRGGADGAAGRSAAAAGRPGDEASRRRRARLARLRRAPRPPRPARATGRRRLRDSAAGRAAGRRARSRPDNRGHGGNGATAAPAAPEPGGSTAAILAAGDDGLRGAGARVGVAARARRGGVAVFGGGHAGIRQQAGRRSGGEGARGDRAGDVRDAWAVR